MKDLLRELRSIRDDRGTLVPLEAGRSVPFDIKRIYYLTKLSGAHPRGFHAHRDLFQFAISLRGSCRFVMDNGVEKHNFLLDSETTGLLIPPRVWHEMHDFSADCTLLVLASEFFDEKDYIRDYDEFRNFLL